MAGITVPSPVKWKGSVYFGRKSKVNTEVDFEGRESCKDSVQTGGLVCHGCEIVKKVTHKKGSHALEDSTIQSYTMSEGSHGTIKNSKITTLSISSAVTNIYYSTISETFNLSQSSSSMLFNKIEKLTTDTCKLMIKSSVIKQLTSKSSDLSLSSVIINTYDISDSQSVMYKGQNLVSSVKSSYYFASRSALSTISSSDKSTVELHVCNGSSAVNKDRCCMYISGSKFKTIDSRSDLWLSRTDVDKLKSPKNQQIINKNIVSETINVQSSRGPEITMVPRGIGNEV